MSLKSDLLIKFMKIATATNVDANCMTLPISINNSNSETHAIDLLRNGNVIAVPTDTVYGLACSAADRKAIKKLYTIKARDPNKPLAVCIDKIDNIKNWAVVNHLSEDLLYNLLPGPVTVILECNGVLDQSLASFGKIGIRIPDYPFLRNIVNKLDYPIALTSANISGKSNSICVEEFKPLWNELSAIFNGGKLGMDNFKCTASTVVDLSRPGFYRIVRSGCAENRINYVLKMYGLKSY